jgi:5-methylcytosine-specific restriction enzyme subunit McrC
VSIPIENIYFLFCYAWGYFPEGQQISASGDKSPDLPNLLTKVLLNGGQHLARRGLHRGYVEEEQETSVPRGTIQIAPTIQRNLVMKRQVQCLVDELSHDVLHNQILKACMRRLVRLPQVESEQRRRLALFVRQRLWNVADIDLRAEHFRRVQIFSNNRFYRFLLKVCELVHLSLLPEAGDGRFRFTDVLEDEAKMSSVFESFVRNFYQQEQDEFRLGRRLISWDFDDLPAEASDVMPGMEGDIRLDSAGHTVLIDTKYYKAALREYYGRTILKSENLYQLFTYLKNLQAELGSTQRLDGILIYPAAQYEVDVSFSVQGHRIRVVTINLSQHWSGIHADLLSLLETSRRSAAA